MTQMKKEPEDFCVARNATTHSENTPRISDFRGKTLNLAFELRNRGYSEAYLATLIRVLTMSLVSMEQSFSGNASSRDSFLSFSILKTT
jgi:hypothetical protein